jgi:bacterioferritin
MRDKNPTIIKLLVEAYAAELETVQNYLANSVWLDGLRAEEIKESLEEDVTEELGHARKLVHRLKQLGARPPGSLELTRSQRSLQPPQDPTDLLSVINGVLEAENDAINKYNEIIRACDGKDWVTQDLAIKILGDEEGHRTLFEGFLKTVSARTDFTDKPGRAEMKQMSRPVRAERQRRF